MFRGTGRIKMAEILYIVVPCYNEDEVLDETTKRLVDKLNRMMQLGKVDAESRILHGII